MPHPHSVAATRHFAHGSGDRNSPRSLSLVLPHPAAVQARNT